MLADLYAHVLEISDPIRNVARHVQYMTAVANSIREDALMSGAMRGEFGVVLRFQRSPSSGFRMIPTLN